MICSSTPYFFPLETQINRSRHAMRGVGNIECVTMSQKMRGNEPNASTLVIKPIITPFKHSFPNYDKLFDSFD